MEATGQPSQSRGSRRRGGRRPGRPGDRGRNPQSHVVSGTGRTFGGRLTTESPPASSNLSAEAAEFVPGQRPGAASSSAPRTPQAAKGKRAAAPKPRPQKSTAEDLPTRIHEDITNRNYECVICAEDVLPSSRVWTCARCWTVLHHGCVRKWHVNQMKENERRELQDHLLVVWRCPGCNLALDEDPGSYHCWCGKEPSPRPIPGLPPHSCGQTCGKKRGGACPHPCELQCHAGPCPPCRLMGEAQVCFCGKHTSTKRCSETDYDEGWSCLEACGDLLPCGEHECQQPCHSGLCGSCCVPVEASCYCGQVQKTIVCDRREQILESFNHGQAGDSSRDSSWFEGSFDCGNGCKRLFDCGAHSCSKRCHPQDEHPAHCPLSPDVLTHCPCGKTLLRDLPSEPRTSCSDDIPSCGRSCGKTLACGHRCRSTCHTGPCNACDEMVDVYCRCGRSSTTEPCREVPEEPPVCERVCQAQLNCGSHKCAKVCCAGEKKYRERVAARKKRSHAPQQAEDVEAEHICLRVCGRPLRCGSHTCPQICHKGACGTCMQAIFDEVSCACGRTVLHPPQPCGTRPPPCTYQCSKRPSCGHPPVQHECHPEEESCPRCVHQVDKLCMCGKRSIKNVQCSLSKVSCGLTCGKTLKCGTHSCTKPCHAAGECEDAGTPGTRCAQTCGKPKTTCEHSCMKPCHSPLPCDEDDPCQATTAITCSCQRLRQEVKCGASKTRPTPQRSTLKCDSKCQEQKRPRELAAAFGINPDTHNNDHVPYSEDTLRLYRESLAFAQKKEKEMREFADDSQRRSLRFQPMPSTQRQFIHLLAEDYGLDSQSFDPEPHRHVSVYKTPRFSSAPFKSLSQCVRIRSLQAAAAREAAKTKSTTPEPGAGPGHPYNSFLLKKPRFGLTIDEIEEAMASETVKCSHIAFSVHFLPSEEVAVRAAPRTGYIAPGALENQIKALLPNLSKSMTQAGLVQAVTLCHADASWTITRREGGSQQAASGGWSVVTSRGAQRAAASTKAPEPQRAPSSFVALVKKPKKVVKEEVVDDWQTAADDAAE